MSRDLDRKVSYLRAAGAHRLEHSGQSRLLDHLLATRALLSAWGAHPAVQDGALFHAVYGTEQFGPASVARERRDEVRALIGERAEALAWLWCVCTRDSLEANLAPTPAGTRADGQGGRPGPGVIDRTTGERAPISPQQLEDLGNLSVANALEQLPRSPSSYDVYASRQLAFEGLALPVGVGLLAQALRERGSRAPDPALMR